jgi:hypothetical protein
VERGIPAELAKHAEVALGYASHPKVGDTMEVYDTCQRLPCDGKLHAIQSLSSDSRCSEVVRNHAEDVGVALARVVETWRIN